MLLKLFIVPTLCTIFKVKSGMVAELLKKLKKEDYFSNANLHIHTCFSDGEALPEEVIRSAVEKNIKYISITDHNTIDAYKHIQSLEHGDLKIIAGVEFDCWYKSNFMHILGYGINLEDEGLKSLCAKSAKETKLDIVRIFSSRKAPDVVQKIKNAGGIAVLAHPCCCWNFNMPKMVSELKSFGLDGIEIYYPYVRHRAIVKFHTIKGMQKIAEDLELLISGGTDCHAKSL